ncbi:hypothetical protein [Primorskyibacter flagellatus]|uniref:GIY-YIG domain-containing protein n=1 Tax=Primorskyibacter flagellatus TaxID=1387277 RepID=A0A1W2DTW5_9RHOB|nr:hypothetical protein [Primorskyibacter flagellatus]SMD00894.1 hypothetical protein SAMN06295998_1184 [Primorskyibacter flagellatus]
MSFEDVRKTRISDQKRFYDLLDSLEKRLGGARVLSDCHGRMDWPQRGVYFFREPGENRNNTDLGPRIVRVGTHALKAGARTKLWNRLSQHRGSAQSGGGNHRGSIFRLLVGNALIERDKQCHSNWGEGSFATREIRQSELPLEQAVSKVIGAMPFLWLPINDEPGPDSLRGYIERNSIALLSNHNRINDRLDPASDNWLGWLCDRDRVKDSGLWNQNHVNEKYDVVFLDTLETLIHELWGTK